MATCEQLMLQGQAQFLLCHGHPEVMLPFPADDFKSIIVGHDRLVAVTGVDAEGCPLWRVDGRNDPISYLGYSLESGLGRIVASQEPELCSQFTRKLVLTSHLAAALLPMARDGKGLAWLPLSLVEPDMAAGLLVRALKHEEDIRLEIRLFRRTTTMSRAAEAFWDLLQVDS